MKTSGDRAAWIQAVASAIMDGGSNPPSMNRLYDLIPSRVGTAVNDGHVTAGEVFGEKSRDDFRMGQRFIIDEVVTVLRERDIVAGDDSALVWTRPLDGVLQIEVDTSVYLIRGQRERRLDADRHMLGERDETEIIKEGRFESARSAPLELDVVGPRGGHELMKFTVHPIALAIPPMTEAERETLRTSIEKDGVKVPIVIFQKKILDGRNRGYFASILKRPVRIEEFTGTEEEAKRHVAILNLHRRHLNTAQRALAAFNLFGEQAKIEAAKAKIQTVGRPNKLRGNFPSISQNRDDYKWQGIAAKKANEVGLNVKPDAIKAMATIALAPQAIATIERGEIKTITKAHEKALEELRRPPTKLPQTADSLSIDRRLGRCITDLTAIIRDTDGEAPIGSTFSISEKVDQIERLIAKVRYALRARNVIY